MFQRILALVFAMLAVLLAAGLGLVFFLKGQIDNQKLFIICFLFSFVAACVVFGLFRTARVVSRGDVGGVVYEATGAPAAFIVFFLVIWLAAPKDPFQRVHVYLNGIDPARPVDRVSISYRSPTGQHTQLGQGKQLTLEDIPRNDSSVTIDSVDCYGYVTKNQKDAMLTPWSFPITSEGNVNIAMVKVQPERVPMPTKMSSCAAIKTKLPKEVALRPPLFTEKQVALTVFNNTDMPVNVVFFNAMLCYYDSEAAKKDGAEALPDGSVLDKEQTIWPASKDLGPGQAAAGEPSTYPLIAGSTLKVPNFNQFWKPSGWFAIYVRYPGLDNKEHQDLLLLSNLFQTRSPRLVIERVEGSYYFTGRVDP